MNICKVITHDIANGTGIRLSVFVSGCKNHCKGCFQPETWDFNYGKKYTKDIEDKIISELNKPYYAGITILGGEPMELENQEDVLKLIKRVKSDCQNKTIWLYTGYILFEDILSKDGKRNTVYSEEIIKLIDVIVDGPFIEEEKDLTLDFRGSKNQKIMYIVK